MKIIEKRIESQMHFWSLLGPFILLLSIAVLLFKISSHWYFPISALIGIPLCVKWKIKGLVGAIGCLSLLFFLNFQNLNLDERYWHLGMGLAIAFSFIILTLSVEEVQSLVEKFQLESQSRLDNFLRLDEKFIQAESDWEKLQGKYQQRVETLTKDLTRVEEEKQTFYKLAQLAKDEILQLRKQYDLLIQELLYKKQQVIQLSERLEESELTVQHLVNSDSESEIRTLKMQLSLLEQEKETLKAQVILASQESEKNRLKNEQISELLSESLKKQEVFEEERKYYQKIENDHLAEVVKFVDELDEADQSYSLLLDHCNQLKSEFDQLSCSQEHLQMSLKELKKSKECLEEKIAEKEFEVNKLQNSHLELEQQLCEKEVEVNKLQNSHLELEQQLCEKEASFHCELIKLKENNLAETKLLKSDENECLKNQLKVLEEQLSDTKSKLDHLQQFQNKLPYVDGNTRRIEGMYIQLKQQFQERNAVLDQTRQELFYSQEKVLQLQKELEEECIYGFSESEISLQKMILELGREIDELQKSHDEECELLEDVIDHLTRGSSN